jgi:hypothetical protein
MFHLPKPYYHIDEVLERWSLTERDLMSFVLSGALTVSATVSGLRITYGICRPSVAGVVDRIATSHSYIIGLIPLQQSDAWRVLRHGELAITALAATADQFAMIDNAAGENQHLVQKTDLVISHEEFMRFEKVHPALGNADVARDTGRRGAPAKFDWDDIWVELCAMIFLDGLPTTQAELVQHIASWLEDQGKRVPDDSTIKKKIKPLWQRLRPTAFKMAVAENIPE